MKTANPVRRIRVSLGMFIAGLIASGITAGPLETELGWLVAVLKAKAAMPAAQATGLLPWTQYVYDAVRTTNGTYPILAYGTDWLVFAHLAIAVAFIGALIDPVRNKWVIEFGLIACACVVPWALVMGGIRGIPLPWRMVDCSFGVFGAVPLAISMRWIRRLEKSAVLV